MCNRGSEFSMKDWRIKMYNERIAIGWKCNIYLCRLVEVFIWHLYLTVTNSKCGVSEFQNFYLIPNFIVTSGSGYKFTEGLSFQIMKICSKLYFCVCVDVTMLLKVDVAIEFEMKSCKTDGHGRLEEVVHSFEF